MAPGTIEVTLFGGCSERSPYKIDETQSKMSETTVWTFYTQNFAHLFEENVSTHSFHSISGWLLANVAINGDLGTDKRIREKIERMKRLASEAGSSQQLPYGRQGVREGQASNDSHTLHQVRQIAEERVVQEIQAREEAERQLQITRTRAEEAEAEVRELGSQWVVQRDEIQFTGDELGRGGGV